MTDQPPAISQEARDRLRAAMSRHAKGDIAGALAEARAALRLEPSYAEARSYVGSTLVMRRGSYAEGLAELERAAEAAPDDPAIHYTLGWCYEFVAHRTSRRPRAGLEPVELYEKAAASLRRCLALEPEGKLKDDAEDLLASIVMEDAE